MSLHSHLFDVVSLSVLPLIFSSFSTYPFLLLELPSHHNYTYIQTTCVCVSLSLMESHLLEFGLNVLLLDCSYADVLNVILVGEEGGLHDVPQLEAV